jgi:hypothetical protein
MSYQITSKIEFVQYFKIFEKYKSTESALNLIENWDYAETSVEILRNLR